MLELREEKQKLKQKEKWTENFSEKYGIVCFLKEEEMMKEGQCLLAILGGK